MLFIEVKDRKELRKKINESEFAVIKKVEGGYMCFEFVTDYEIWKNQN